MKYLKILFFISVLLFFTKVSHAYEKLDFFDNFHIYTPYIYITQDDTIIKEAKILILFHDCVKAKSKEQQTCDFAKEAANWEYPAEKAKIFIMGFDIENYASFDKEKMDMVNKRILMEIDRMKSTCGTKKTKVFVAGTNFGGDIALLFNSVYDNYDGALCMNISKPTKDIEKNLDKCKNKNFYFFHCEKSKNMSAGKVKSLSNKLIKNGAKVEEKVYKDCKNILPYKAYLNAIDKMINK